MQDLLERFQKMAEYPLGHMSTLFASILIREPEMDSVQNTDEDNHFPTSPQASDLRSVHLRFLNA